MRTVGAKIGSVGKFSLYSRRFPNGHVAQDQAVIVLDDGIDESRIGVIPAAAGPALEAAVKEYIATWLKGQESVIAGFRTTPPPEVGDRYLQTLIPRRDRVRKAFEEIAGVAT